MAVEDFQAGDMEQGQHHSAVDQCWAPDLTDGISELNLALASFALPYSVCVRECLFVCFQKVF